tara:strand:+ start:731 stop:1225 length:495 start_codon:yes stop_codon:yes gene_type:complete
VTFSDQLMELRVQLVRLVSFKVVRGGILATSVLVGAVFLNSSYNQYAESLSIYRKAMLDQAWISNVIPLLRGMKTDAGHEVGKPPGSILSSVTSVASERNVVVARADYVGESSLAIALEPAVFEDVVSILLELELQESLTIESVVINAGDILGTCRSRIIINID